jgi:hypothetical protein
MYLAKNKLINFLYFLKKTDDAIIKDNIYLEILSYYDAKSKFLFIDNKNLNNLITKYTKETLIKKLANLVRTEQIEYPYLSLFIDIKTITKIIKGLDNIIIEEKITNNKHIIYTLKTDNIINNIKLYDINFFKNNLNYCLINYFAEKDILKCKKKEYFAAPYELIFSKNNYLENLFDYLITTNNEITSTLMKIYIKKNIKFCLDNNILHIIAILKKNFNELLNNKFNILNLGIDWGEWNILANLYENMQCDSFYYNNLQKDTIKNITKHFNTKNISQMQIGITYTPKEYHSNKYDLVYINLEALLTLFMASNETDETIFDNQIIPILTKLNTTYIIFKLHINYDKLHIFEKFNKKLYNITNNIIIENSLYLIYKKK